MEFEAELKAISVALRVLTAICVECKSPLQSDLEALWGLAETDQERAMPVDELAHCVIVRMRHKLAVLRAGKAQTAGIS